ncbi:MAG: thioredoxin family protein [Cytophagales bacterium]|nr:thioredoxin family protein [Cytophagales bacterium]
MVHLGGSPANGSKGAAADFVDMYTDWCGWCKRMDKTTFSDASVAEFVANNYYAVKMNAESSDQLLFKGQLVTPRQLTQAFGVTGFPTIVLMDQNLGNVQPVPGYRDAKGFTDLLKKYQELVN